MVADDERPGYSGPVNDEPPVPENWWGDWRKFFGWLALGIAVLVVPMVLTVWLIL